MKKQILTLVAAMAALSGYAQWNGDTLTITAAELADVDVVAQRVQQVTTNHETLQHEQLNRENTGQNLPYLLQMTPSLITMSDDGLGIGYTYFRVRGTDQSRINMTVNDVPLNDSESQTVFWVNMTDMASSMSRIDVQRGVGTSTNGIAAFGASVNMSTLTSDTLSHVTLGFNGGMYKTFREMIQAHVVLPNKKWQMNARFSKVNSDGFLYHSASDLYSYHGDMGYYGDRTQVVLSVFGGSEKTGMAWDGVDYNTAYGIDGADRRYNPAGEYTYTYYDEQGEQHEETRVYPNQKDVYAQQHAQLHVQHRFTPAWSLSGTLHYTHGGGYYDQYKSGRKWGKYGLSTPVDEEGNPIKKTDLIQIKNLNNHFAGGVVSAKYVSEPVDVQFGGAGNHYIGSHWGNVTWTSVPYEIPYDYEYYRSKAHKTDANIFAKANWRIINRAQEQLSLYGDLQYRFVNYRIDGINDEDLSKFDVNENFHFFNPKAGLTYYNHGHLLYGSFAIANREPSRNNYKESLNILPDGTVEKPKAERLYDYELGYTYSHRLFSVGANLYMMDYDNQLVLTGAMSSTGAKLTKNVKDSYRMGIELQGEIRPVDWFAWQLNLTISRNKILNYKDYVDLYDAETWDWIDSQERDFGTTTIAFAPSVIFGSNIHFGYAGFSADIQTSAISKQYLDNSQNETATLRAYSTTNLNLQYQIPMPARAPQIKLLCQVNNLFNAKYAANGGSDMSYLIDKNGTLTNAWPWYYAQAGINAHAGFVINW